MARAAEPLQVPPARLCQGQRPLNVDCVFFDAGNTLVHPVPPVGEVYARALRERGINADAEDVLLRFRHVCTVLRRQRQGEGLCYGATDADARRWWREVVMLTFERFGTIPDPDQAFEQLWNHFASPTAWEVFPDVVPALKALRERGVRLGIIGNWDVRIVPLLEGLGLWGLFDAVTASFQVGAEKPDSRIFSEALARCQVGPQRALHVGDSYEEDVLGAVGAGMRAVWLRRGAHGLHDCHDATVISTLAEVPELLRGA